MIDPGAIIERIDQAIKLGEEAIKKAHIDSHHTAWASPQEFASFRASGLSVIRDVYGVHHPIYTDFSSNTRRPIVYATHQGIGVLNAAKTEIEKGWLSTVKGLLTAEIFSDFLEMSLHLLDEGYKDPAAVVIGSVVEKQLKELSVSNGISLTRESREGKPIPKKADSLNAELVKKGVYSKLDQKAVTAWLGIRNNAAHGNYDEYNSEQVRTMHSGVTEFITRTNS